MSLSSWIWGAPQIDEAIDKATSELMPSGTEDMALNLEIADQIRSKSVAPKDAMRSLKRRLDHKNPNVKLLSLSLTDTCVKNGGDHFLVEIASREFMDNLVSILKMPALNVDVKNKILRLVQNWALAFEGKPGLSYVGQMYKALKSEGFNFPPQDIAATSSAMIDTQTAPEWIDSDVCLRCRTPFSFTNRKHHCRNCGQVFDQQCSSKILPLPHFGIQQEVRVCDACYAKLTRIKKEEKKHHHRRFSSPRHRSAKELADDELQRAIQLSLEEVGAAQVNGRNYRPGYVPAQPRQPAYDDYNKWQVSEPPIVDQSTRPPIASSGEDEENDPDLKAAIEASLREANAPKASAPEPVQTPRPERFEFPHTQPSASQSYPTIPNIPSYDLAPLEVDAIMTFSQTVEQVEAQGGRDMSRYPAVNELYDRANGLRPKLALSLDDVDRKEKTLTDMHDKLSQAVKLYDKLLTEQLSRPAWRSSPASSHPRHPSQYNTVDGSYQWNSNPIAQSPGPAYFASYDRQQQVQLSYNHQDPQPQSRRIQSPSQQLAVSPSVETQYHPPSQTHQPQVNGQFTYSSFTDPSGGPVAATAAYGPPQTLASSISQYSSPPPSIPTQLPHQSTPQYNLPPQSSANPTITSSPPAVSSLPATSLGPSQYSVAPAAAHYVQPNQALAAASENTPSSALPITTHQQQQTLYQSPLPLSSPQTTSSRTTSIPQAPAISNLSYGIPQQSTQPHVVSPSATPSSQQQIIPQAPIQTAVQFPQQFPQATPNLPQFPVAPTNAPQSYPLYGPSAPIGSGVEQTERKEALLIDL